MQAHRINCRTGQVETVTLPDPAPVVPRTITKRQLRLALMDAGKLAQAKTAMATAPVRIQMDWEDSTEFRRDGRLIAWLQTALGVSNRAVNNVFIAGAAEEDA